jgi:tetratricopeptide (TPR) repeat protein
VWPYPLVVDYGTDVVTSASDVLPQALFLLSLVAGTLVALRRRPVAGFVGCWFFVLLAPSSSVIPLVGQTVAEHRMYLPLVSVIVLIVVGVHSLAGRAGPIIYLLLATTLGVMTLLRNTDYRSELSIWQDTVTHRPDNPRAQYNLGLTLAREGRDAEAINHYEEALRLQPNYPKVRNNLGIALANSGRISEAIANFTELLRLDPNDADAHNNLGSALAQSGRMADAIEHFQAALRLQPNNISAQNNLAAALLLGTQ